MCSKSWIDTSTLDMRSDGIKKIVEETIAENPKSVEDYKAGNEKAIGFLVGQVMKKSRGKANPDMVNNLLKDKLNQ